mgnify:CR=1 FL=1
MLLFRGKYTWPDISKDEWIQVNVDGYNGDLSALGKIFFNVISGE